PTTQLYTLSLHDALPIFAAGRVLDTSIYKVAIVRLLSDGTVDPAFSALFTAGDGGEASANAVASQGDGKVVVAGYARDAGATKADRKSTRLNSSHVSISY